MLNLLRLSIGAVLALMLWTAMAQGQTLPVCDPQGKTMHEFQARVAPAC